LWKLLIPGDVVLGKTLVDALVKEGVYQQYTQNGIVYVSKRQVTAGIEEGVLGKIGVTKVFCFFVGLSF